MTTSTPALMVIGHGVDIIANDRIAAVLGEHGDRFRDRVFTAGEQAYCENARKRRIERYAARFAAKEAALKALGTGWRSGIAWTDVEVVSEVSGKPRLRVSGRCAEIAVHSGIDTWRVSLSHAAAYSIASVLAGYCPP